MRQVLQRVAVLRALSYVCVLVLLAGTSLNGANAVVIRNAPEREASSSSCLNPPDSPLRDLETGRNHVIVVLGDLHGDLETTLELLHAAQLIQWSPMVHDVTIVGSILRDMRKFNQTIEWTGNKTILLQMGDIVDRGPDGYLLYELFRHLAHEAKKDGGQVIHLFGNHELLNMCHVDTYVNLDEIRDYYDDNVTDWKHTWSRDGELGGWMRQNFNVVKRLFGRFLFVHAGLSSHAARFTPDQLKAVLLHRVDEEKCSLKSFDWSLHHGVGRTHVSGVTTVDPSSEDVQFPGWPSTPLDRNQHGIRLLQEFAGEKDVLWGDKGPHWIRSLSVEPEKVVCREIQQALAQAFPSDSSEGREHKSVQGSDHDQNKLTFMIVGHTVTESENIEFRCPVDNAQSASLLDKGASLITPSRYIMVDTGISRSVGGSPNALRITLSDSVIAFHQIAADGSVSLRMLVPTVLNESNGKKSANDGLKVPNHSP